MKRLPKFELRRLSLRELTPRDAYGRFVSTKRHRRGRRNPVLLPEGFNQRVAAFREEINQQYIGKIIRGLRKVGLARPDDRAINAAILKLATIMAESGDIELADQSRLDDPAKDVVTETLGFVAGGVWEDVWDDPEGKKLAEPYLKELAGRLEIMRIPALNARKELGVSGPQVDQEDEEAALEEQFAAEFGEEGAADEEGAVDEEEELTPPPKKPKSGKKAKTEEGDEPLSVAERLQRAAESAAKKDRRSRQGDGRVPPEQVIETMRVAQGRAVLREDCKADLEGFKRFEATRRSPIRPSAAVLEATKKDVLLFMLQDRTTQVWAKGAITVTFAAPGQGLSSIQKAAQYAKIWRECKKSRHECRIVVGVEGSDEYLVKAPALVGPASTGEPLSLASVGKAAGIEEKSNPRRKNRARQVSAAAFWPKALRNLKIRTPDRELASFIRNPLR